MTDNISLVIKKHSMMKTLVRYALSWNLPHKVIFLKKIKLISKQEPNINNNKYGKH